MLRPPIHLVALFVSAVLAEMSVTVQKPPPGLGTAGRKLWREICAPLADDDLELTPRERNWLHSACT
jgi:hypothetical protein